MSGYILLVSWPQLIKTAVIYSLLGFIHYGVKDKLLLISENPEEAQRQDLKIKYWDLFFYLSFGVVITSSVQMAGILLVFVFLVIPACCSLLFFQRTYYRIFFGILLGLGTSSMGLLASSYADFPSGPTIVVCFGIIFYRVFSVKKITLRFKLTPLFE